jgi:hypothetical protein
MPDDTHPHDDPDETQTQWVAAGPTSGEQAVPDRPDEEHDSGGWFSPTAPTAPVPTASSTTAAQSDEPKWAEWDDPWVPADEPFDQAALPPTEGAIDDGSPDGDADSGGADLPSEIPEARAPSEYVSPYPTHTSYGAESSADQDSRWTDDPKRDSAAQPQSATEWPSEPTGTRSSSLASLHQLRVLAQVACPILLFVGLTFAEDHQERGWQAYTAWACFAMVCAIVQLAPLVGRSLGMTAENAWFLAAVGTAGLVGYWVIIVLPGVSSNTGFAQTLAAGFAVIGLWLSPGRRQ